VNDPREAAIACHSPAFGDDRKWLLAMDGICGRGGKPQGPATPKRESRNGRSGIGRGMAPASQRNTAGKR